MNFEMDFQTPLEINNPAVASYRDHNFLSKEMIAMLKRQNFENIPAKYREISPYDQCCIFPSWILSEPNWNNSDRKKSKNS